MSNQGSILSVVFRYVGAYKDFTGWLGERPNQFKVEDGRTTLVGSAPYVEATGRHLGLLYQAFPEGSPELAAKELEVYGTPKGEGEGEGDGSGDLQAGGALSNGPADVPGADRQDGGQPPEEGAGNVGGAGDTPAGEAERGADGNGSEDLVNDPKPEGDAKLAKALAKLDPENDDHWTKDGLPALAAVESLYGSAGLKRADITAAAPGLRRTNAPKLG